MKWDEQKKLLEDGVDKIITDLKSDRDKNIKKLSGFKEITKKYVDKAKVIDPKNRSWFLQYNTTEFIVKWIEYLTEKMYETQMVICENWKIMLMLNNEISDDKERKVKLEGLENSIKKIQKQIQPIEPFIKELDKVSQRLREEEEELKKRGIYG